MFNAVLYMVGCAMLGALFANAFLCSQHPALVVGQAVAVFTVFFALVKHRVDLLVLEAKSR